MPAEADIIIEGYCDPTETKLEGPFGDHYGFYSLTGQYPVLHVTAITCRSTPSFRPPSWVCRPWKTATSVRPSVAILARASVPTPRRQERPPSLETGFHNLAIVASKQRYPRQGRKRLGLWVRGK